MLKPISYFLGSRHRKSPSHALSATKPRSELVPVLRSEVNTLIYPCFFLSKGKTVDVIETHTVRRQGDQTFEALWRVTPHPAAGRPGPFAHRVHRAIEQLVTEKGLPATNPICFSIHNLCRRMGIAAGGTEYRNVKQALTAIRGTQLQSKGMFYSKAQSRYIDEVFSLYDRIIFTGERLADGTLTEKNLLFLGTWYLESLNSLYVKPLDYGYYLKLHTPISRRLYELLGVKFYGVIGNPEPLIRYRYSTLCHLLPVKRYYYRSRLTQQLDAAHKELTQSGFIKTPQVIGIPHKRDWYLIYRPGEKATQEIRRTNSKRKDKKQERKYGGYSSGLRGGRHGTG